MEKILVTQYIAVDGTLFSREKDCQEYEYSFIDNQPFKMYDEKLNPTNKMYNVRYVYFPNMEEIDTFNDLCREYICTEIEEWDETATSVIYYYYFDKQNDIIEWRELNENTGELEYVMNEILFRNF